MNQGKETHFFQLVQLHLFKFYQCVYVALFNLTKCDITELITHFLDVKYCWSQTLQNNKSQLLRWRESLELFVKVS